MSVGGVGRVEGEVEVFFLAILNYGEQRPKLVRRVEVFEGNMNENEVQRAS